MTDARNRRRIKEGAYATGEMPEVGDVIECLPGEGAHHPGHVIREDEQYTVVEIDGGYVFFDDDYGCWPTRFALVERVKTPWAASPAEQPEGKTPMVKGRLPVIQNNGGLWIISDGGHDRLNMAGEWIIESEVSSAWPDREAAVAFAMQYADQKGTEAMPLNAAWIESQQMSPSESSSFPGMPKAAAIRRWMAFGWVLIALKVRGAATLDSRR